MSEHHFVASVLKRELFAGQGGADSKVVPIALVRGVEFEGWNSQQSVLLVAGRDQSLPFQRTEVVGCLFAREGPRFRLP